MSAQSSSTGNTDTIQGFTKEGLAAFNAHSHGMVNDGKLANVVTLIARHGEIVSCDAYGVLDASAASPVPVRTDSIYRIASMTKPITSAAMMMLWEEGKWALEDPVSKFVPEFEGLKVKQDDGSLVPQASPMTMKQLISHSAGFGARLEYPELRGGTLQDMIDYLATQPLAFQPGKGWRYGPSIDVLGYIIQKLTGKFLDEFLEERIFAPLGMVDSGFVLPASKVNRLVNNHRHDMQGRLVAVNLRGTYHSSRPRFLGGGGGLMLSTIKDYWRFSQMILNGGEFEGKRYLEPITVEMMHTNVLEPGIGLRLYRRDIHGLGFGLGYAIVQNPAIARTSQRAQSFFWGGLFGTWFWIDPVNDMIVIGFNNNSAFSRLTAGPLAKEIAAQLVFKAMDKSGCS